jgi:hypothetical protein
MHADRINRAYSPRTIAVAVVDGKLVIVHISFASFGTFAPFLCSFCPRQRTTSVRERA